MISPRTLLLLLCIGFGFAPLAVRAQGIRDQKKVLVIWAVRRDGPRSAVGESIYQRVFRDGLDGRLDYYSEYIDVARFPNPEYQASLHQLLIQKYKDKPPDLVIGTSLTANDFITQYRAELFPNAPAVFIASPGFVPGANTTAVTAPLDLSGTLDLVVALQPDTRRIFVVSGASEYDRFYENLAKTQLKRFEDKLEITYLTGLPMAELVGKVARLPERSVIYYLTFVEEPNGNKYLAADSLDKVAPVANVPIYSWHEVLMDHGIVGGDLQTSDATTIKSAELALKILKGENPESIPVVEIDPTVVQVDWRQLQRWGISESRVPAGTLVRFKQPTIWQQYKWQIIGVAAVLLLQTLLIAGLLIERDRRWRATRGLSESEERYRNVVQTQTEMICRYLPDTTLTFVNDAYCRYFDKSREELIGTKFLDLIPVYARQNTLIHVQSLIDNPRIEVNEHEAILADGTIAWQQWVDHVITNGGGRVKELQGIGRDITDRKRLEEEPLQAEKELGQLTARLFNLQDEERRRIARELHDGTAQNLFAISIDIDLLRKQFSNGNSECTGLLDETQSLCDQSMQEIRTLSYLLHPPLLDQAGLVSALKWYVDGFIKRTGIEVDLVALDNIGRMRSEIETALFRIVQEALTNSPSLTK